MPHRPPPTVETIKEGCTKLANQMASLQREVSGLTAKLQLFKKGREIPKAMSPLEPLYLDWHRGERGETPEPKRPIAELVIELKDQAEVDLANRVLVAIGLEMDSAVREVRAARSTLQAIADDSDLRAEFKHWQSR